jgi:hypothetical protein
MKKFIKSLNWGGALFMFVFCGLGAMSRKNEDIQTSLMVWLVFGLPISLLFLFVGREK